VNVVVLGAGAVGSLFGARLAAAGHRVTLVGRPEHVRSVREGGLRVEGVGAGTFSLEATADLASAGPADVVLLTVKTFDLDPTATLLGRTLAPIPTLLTQNGLGVEGRAIEALRGAGWDRPADWVVRAVNSVPSTWVGPGAVRASGTGEVVLPQPKGRAPRDRMIERFGELLRSAGFSVRFSEAFDREIWRKVLVNAAINPVTALHGVPNGRLESGPLRAEAVGLLREALAVAHAEGFALPKKDAEADLDRVVRATSENRSSMLQDLDRGRPTEVDAILGEILRAGTRHGIDLPRTREAAAAIRRRTGAPQG
jgi:2-dehydropantoate 2-reductase